MRSRFSAYAVGDSDYVWRSWHPRTRPERVAPDPSIRWLRLEILAAAAGADADVETVEFRAHFTGPNGAGVLHERSRFVERAGRWFYLDGEVG